MDFLSLGLIQEWIPRGIISGVRDAVPESIDARVHSTMRALRYRVKVAGGNDTSLRKIKVVASAIKGVAKSARGLPAEMGTRTAGLGGLMHVNTSLSNVTSSRGCREVLARPIRAISGEVFVAIGYHPICRQTCASRFADALSRQRQCDIRTGVDMCWSTCRLAPPNTNSRNRACP